MGRWEGGGRMGRGWAAVRGVGWVEGVCGKPEVGYTIQLDCLE